MALPASPAIHVRDATAEDREFVLGAAPRLAAFDTPGWRTPDEIWAGEARTLDAWFDGAVSGTLLIASRGAARAGYVFLERHTDYFTQRPHGHVGILVVTAEAEGSGVGRALIAAAEAWARAAGDDRLTLNVFDSNTRAKAVYERLGFSAETVRYVKRLG